MKPTQAMVEAGARALFSKTKIADKVTYDLLPRTAQFDMREMSLAVLLAAEPLRDNDPA